MRVKIFAEDKSAEKVFEDKLEVADNVLLLSYLYDLRNDCLCSALKE